VGRTDGKSPERGWVKLNVLAPSTWEMGPGRRRDTIDCNIGDENWKKFFGIGKRSTTHSMVLYTTDSAPQVKLCDGKSSQQLKRWRNIRSPIRNSNQLYPSPPSTNGQRISRSGRLIHHNQIPEAGPTLAAVQRQLIDDEAKDLAEGRDSTLDSWVSLSVLILEGIDLEAEQ